MTVDLLHYTPLNLAANAIRMSHDNHHLSDSIEGTNDCGPKDRALIERVGNKLKHKSTLEQLVYTFDINHVSRALLQELARHRTARLTVKSSRYTLKELKDEPFFLNGWCISDTFEETDFNEDGYERASKYLVLTNNFAIDLCAIGALDNVIELLNKGYSNDKVKYALPEAYATRLQWQIDGRNLQNFLELRSSKDALWEIRQLAIAIYQALPTDHQYLFTEYVKDIE